MSSEIIPTPTSAIEGLLTLTENLQSLINAVRLAEAQGDESGFWNALQQVDQAIAELPKVAAVTHAAIDGLKAAIEAMRGEVDRARHEGYQQGAEDMLNGGYTGELDPDDWDIDPDMPMLIEVYSPEADHE